MQRGDGGGAVSASAAPTHGRTPRRVEAARHRSAASAFARLALDPAPALTLRCFGTLLRPRAFLGASLAATRLEAAPATLRCDDAERPTPCWALLDGYISPAGLASLSLPPPQPLSSASTDAQPFTLNLSYASPRPPVAPPPRRRTPVHAHLRQLRTHHDLRRQQDQRLGPHAHREQAAARAPAQRRREERAAGHSRRE